MTGKDETAVNVRSLEGLIATPDHASYAPQEMLGQGDDPGDYRTVSFS
jgi:hypothetical protein